MRVHQLEVKVAKPRSNHLQSLPQLDSRSRRERPELHLVDLAGLQLWPHTQDIEFLELKDPGLTVQFDAAGRRNPPLQESLVARPVDLSQAFVQDLEKVDVGHGLRAIDEGE